MMVERENLPANLAAQELTTSTGMRGSLVARGMAALANKSDTLYRQAREVYNRFTDDGLSHWFGYEDRELPLTEAFNIFLQLAREGYGKAYFPLSTLYTGEQSVKGDTAQAERFRKLAFDWLFANQLQNDPEIWNDLGKLYLYLATDSNYYGNKDIAFIWFLKAANMGDANAMWHVSGMYEDCRFNGWQSDYEDGGDSLHWQIKAAKAGHKEAQHGLEQQHKHGDLETKIDDEQVFDWYVWSAEHGHVWAQLFLADAYRYGAGVDEDAEQAAHWFRMAAEQGDEQGQWELGLMYQEGLGVGQNDEQAVYWFRKAAELGNDEAQWLLGGMYEYGRGVIPDIEQAEFWYRKSAEQAGEKAQLSLDEMFDAGHGATLNEEQVTYWNIKSAEKGHVWAMRNLGLMYQNGLRVEQDDEQAAYWFSKLPSNKNEDILQLNVLLEGLTPEQQKEIIHKVATKLAEQAILRRNERAK